MCGSGAVTTLSARRCSLACDGWATLGTLDRVKDSYWMLLEKRRGGRLAPGSLGVVNAVQRGNERRRVKGPYGVGRRVYVAHCTIYSTG